MKNSNEVLNYSSIDVPPQFLVIVITLMDFNCLFSWLIISNNWCFNKSDKIIETWGTNYLRRMQLLIILKTLYIHQVWMVLILTSCAIRKCKYKAIYLLTELLTLTVTLLLAVAMLLMVPMLKKVTISVTIRGILTVCIKSKQKRVLFNICTCTYLMYD